MAVPGLALQCLSWPKYSFTDAVWERHLGISQLHFTGVCGELNAEVNYTTMKWNFGVETICGPMR